MPASAEATGWYRLSAEASIADSQARLGQFFEAGQVVPQDYAEAVKWYSRAAAQAHLDSQLRLDSCHELGRGVA